MQFVEYTKRRLTPPILNLLLPVKMVFKKIMLLVLVAVSLLLSDQVGGTSISREEDMELQKELKRLNKPPIKSIQEEGGTIIDCIDINKQPAFDHPLLRNHTIQMRPSSYPKETVIEDSMILKPAIIGLKSGGCPQGSVPIRRTRKEDLIVAKSLSSANVHPLTLQQPGYHFATARTRDSTKKYYGARAWISSRNPSVEIDQFSEAVIWIQNRITDQLNSIQIGWTVNPRLYGDNHTRTFTYWTADGYQKTGCFNTLCPGFVQVNAHHHFGAPLSISGGSIFNQYAFVPTVYKDPGTGNWWYLVKTDKAKNEPVGYWPKSLFTGLADFASEIEFGGEVYSPPSKPPPPMGSGLFIPNIWPKTGFIGKIHTVNGFNKLVEPVSLTMATFSDKPDCYHVKYQGFWGFIVRYTMMYGGAGGPNCRD
ncbi:hypothetical protein HHK36_027460 [Tetracentron sinense]|uniref:Neprosin PEP catalytic domain-containing protein n=1 Tax=Tetracentron sinense TaxID=13715 RepID=A0A835D1A1_TETSI|nr:hypothetical protein HHK36_027460 [Tetracentron sinense]